MEQFMYEECEEKVKNENMDTSRSSLIEGRCELLTKSTEWMETPEEEDGCMGKIRGKFLRSVNMMRLRRLTTEVDGRPLGASFKTMHKDNIRRLKNAYKHPFQKINHDIIENL
jgi:hypothetical protein